jgi:hypothetical protein
VHIPDRRLPERRYILDVVLSRWLGLDYEIAIHDEPTAAIRLIGDPAAKVLRIADVLLATPAEAWLREKSLPALPLARLSSDRADIRAPGEQPPIAPGHAAAGAFVGLPVLFGTPGPSGAGWTPTTDGQMLDVDVLGSIFFLLTRYEELVCPTLDAHGRFPGSSSIADRDGCLERPLADEYTDLLWRAMSSLWPTLRRQPTAFALFLTHDVDQPWAVHGQPVGRVARSLVADLARRRDPRLAARRLTAAVGARAGRVGRDPIDRFDLFMQASERHGLRSTFFFQAGLTPRDFDFRYRISDPSMVALLRRVHERGHEVGLHASYISHGSEAQVRREFAALRSACAMAGFDQPTWGVRQHFLRFSVAHTWRHLAAAGLAYDTTLGFADRVGFRAGTCRRFPVFDLDERQVLDIDERPLIAMDTTLFEQLRLGLEGAAKRVTALVDACRRERGEAVLLYHNNTLPGARFERHYSDLVADLAPESERHRG